MSSLLIDESPLMVLPTLAKKIGLNEAIVLQQIHFWLKAASVNEKVGARIDGQCWIYNSTGNWCEQFPFWSKRTVERVFANLRKLNLIEVKNLASDPFDRTLYYRINRRQLDDILTANLAESKASKWLDDNDAANLAVSKTSERRDLYITETTTTIDKNTKPIELSPPSETATPLPKKSPQKTANIEPTKSLPDWLPAKDWGDFLAMRKKMGKGATPRAEELLIARLDKLRQQGHDPARVLQESIINGWQGVFPLKEERPTSSKPKAENFAAKNYGVSRPI